MNALTRKQHAALDRKPRSPHSAQTGRAPHVRLRDGRRLLGHGAFTLIEIMIAITIFSLVLLAIYTSWTAILRGSKAGLTAAAEAQRTRMALRTLAEALGSAQLYTANIQYYFFFADTSSDFASLSFVSYLPESFPGSGLFHGQAVRRVSFSVEPGAKSQHQLVLRQSPLLEPPESAAQPYSIVLAPNVSRFEMEFLDTNSVKWLPEWVSTNKLPRVVRIVLAFGEKGRGLARPDDLVIQTVQLTSAAIPRELQNGLAGRGLGPGMQPGGIGTTPRVGPGNLNQNRGLQAPQFTNPRGR